MARRQFSAVLRRSDYAPPNRRPEDWLPPVPEVAATGGGGTTLEIDGGDATSTTPSIEIDGGEA